MTASLIFLITVGFVGAEPVKVGSKAFTESVILGDMAAELLEDGGVTAKHLRELGGTQILFHALEAGELDVYPEYTGTIKAEIFAGRTFADDQKIREGTRLTWG